MSHGEYAAQLFVSGYNCAQAVAVAFGDLTGLDAATAARMVSPFGGGLSRQREVCGAISGMCMVLGYLYGYEPPDPQRQKALYADVQALCAKFREQAGSIVCREILKNPPSDPAPTPRTAEFYAQRPCARMVLLAANILDSYIKEHSEEIVGI